MSSIHAGTMLAYLAGAAFVVCAIMAVYWSYRKVPPGFGLWTISLAFIAVGCLLLADSSHFARGLIVIGVPGLILIAVALRVEAARQYLGYKRLRGWLLLLPALGVGLISVFTYAWDQAAARSTVTAMTIAGVLGYMAVLSLVKARTAHLPGSSSMVLAFGLYGALWLLSGIHWLVSGRGFPLGELDLASQIFFAGATLFEVIGLIGALILTARWNAARLEAAHGILEKEHRQLAEIVAFLPDATFALDKELRVVAWNRVAEAKTGIQASEIMGARLDESPMRAVMDGSITLSEVLLDPSRPLTPQYRHVRRDEDSLAGEKEWRDPTGSEPSGQFWHLARLLRDADGNVTGTIESVREVTERAEAEGAVRESEERYRSLFTHSLDGILVIAPGGAVADANPSACRMLGMTREEICAADPGSLIGRAGRERNDDLEQMTPGTVVRELDFVRGDGSTFPAETMSVVWNDSVGHLRAFVQFRDITERVVAQEILRESEASLVENRTASPTGSWYIDTVGRTVWMSPWALRIHGLGAHSSYFPLEEGSLTDLVQEPEVLRSELRRVMTDGGSYDLEYVIKRDDDGALRKVRSIGAAVCNAEGKPVRVVGVTQDITESRAVPDLVDAELYLQDKSDDQVYWIDAAGRMVNVNQAACQQLGYTREELLGMTIYELNPSLPSGMAESPGGVKGAGLRRYETVHRTKDGRDMPVELSITYASLDSAEYKFVVAKDISERKRLEESLQRTQLSLGRGGDAILWADSGGQLTFATDAACDTLGLRREELLSLNIRDVDVEMVEEWGRVWAGVLEEGSLVRRTSYRTKAGKTKPVDAYFSHVVHAGSDYALIVIGDAGERQSGSSASPEGGLDELQNRELEAVGQLAGGIAHDFNNLLSAIIGYGDLILGSEEDQSVGSLRRDVAEIRNAAEKAAALTSQVLAFARRQPLRPRKVDIGELVAEMKSQIQDVMPEGVTLNVGIASEPGVAEIDTEQFERVVMNLTQNALEAMPDGGRLSVDVDNIELTEEYCRAYPELRAGMHVVLSVSDTGVGMDAATRLRIFEPFFTTKPPGEGPGLGLSEVYGVVRQSGGYVVAYSEVDSGTTMKVYLPRLTEASEPVERERPVAPVNGGGETILFVDDEPPLRRLVARVLGEAGYRVFVAGSGPEALELLDDLVDPPDVLLTDVILPGGLQGNELATRVHSKLPDLPVLYMSGHPRDAIVHAGRLDEGVAFLGKPFSPETLLSRVHEVLDTGRDVRRK